MGDLTITFDGFITEINPTGAAFFGTEPNELINSHFIELITPEDSERWYIAFRAMKLSLGKEHKLELSFQRSDNTVFTAQLSCMIVTTVDNDRMTRIKFNDITDRKRQELELRIAATIFESQESIAVTDKSGIILRTNKAFATMTGYSEAELAGRKISILKSDRHNETFYADIWKSITNTSAWEGEIWNRRSNSNIYPSWLSIRAVKDDDQSITHYVATYTDIIARKKTEAENQRLVLLYNALNQSNQAIIHSTNENALFMQACFDVVFLCGVEMAWIGLLDEQSKQLKSVASYGSGTEYLEDIEISTNRYDCAALHAIHEDQSYWSSNLEFGSDSILWQQHGAKFGLCNSAALPLHRNGKVIGSFNVYASKFNLFDHDAQRLFVKMAENIDFAIANFDRETQRQQAEKSLSEAYSLLKTIIDTAPVRIFWKDKDLRYLGCNTSFAADAGIDQQSIIGKNDYELDWCEQAELYRTDDQQVMDSGVSKLFYEEVQTTFNGSLVNLRSSKVPLKNDSNETIGVLGIYENITEQKHTEERMRYLTMFDSLTGLPNRTQLHENFNYAIRLAKRNKENLALLFIDLDHFKDINDTLGHSVGDILLIEFSKRIRNLLREGDTLTRMGGDEFILLLPAVNANGAELVAQKLLNTIGESYQIEDLELTLTASIGIAQYPEDGTDLETLFKCADAAMFLSKHEGRNCYRFFTTEMQERSSRNLHLTNALRNALTNNQLHIEYQPQIAIDTGHIIGTEALLRWQHPDFGLVSPSEFIPIAESTGLILPIGEWVLRSVVRQAKTWISSGFRPIIMAVNLSSVQFRHPDLLKLVSRILREEGLPPEYLELELTEGAAMHNPLDASIVINNLNLLGVRMSIDDFGTGYSSLSYLKKFKVYKIKIDQSFVRDIIIDPDDKAIVSAIINLSKSLGLKTIAEGVETEEQRELLRLQGCDEIQGYFYSKPLSIEQMEALLKKTITT